jgi:hypothetical protein
MKKTMLKMTSILIIWLLLLPIGIKTQVKLKKLEKSLLLSLPDLVVSINCPNQAYPGEELNKSIKVIIKNNGTAPAKDFSIDVILSSDTIIPIKSAFYSPKFQEDVLLEGGREYIKFLAPRTQKELTLHGKNKIPDDVPSGNYYLGVVVDSGNKVLESNEKNNTALCRIRISKFPLQVKIPNEGEFIPSPEQQELAKNMLRAFIIECENYIKYPELRKSKILRDFSQFMKELNPKAREHLTNAVNMLTSQNEVYQKNFFGKFYAPTPELRLKHLPSLLIYIKKLRKILVPTIILKENIEDSVYEQEIIPAPGGYITYPNFPLISEPLSNLDSSSSSKGYKNALTRLKSINIKDGTEWGKEEIYFGIIRINAFGNYSSYRKPRDHWSCRDTYNKKNSILGTFGLPKERKKIYLSVSVFEKDEGNWNEVVSYLNKAAKYAAKKYLEQELGGGLIGTALAEAIFSFLDPLFDYIFGWFENEDDYIGIFTTWATVKRGDKKWKSTGSRYGKLRHKTIKGSGAKIVIGYRWELYN